jgi:maltose/moltooligosaccharide transporter
MDKPAQTNWGLWNISFGNLGIAIAFSLQQGNMSRIFQTLGAELDKLPFLMIAGPVTGLIVQPLIGHYSDRTWGRFGRRRPYFMAGAVLAALALFVMPGATLLWMAAGLLWILDASLNISMEPFRAFVGDMVPAGQRAKGFAFNTALGCIGAVIGSLAPIAMTMLGVSNVAAVGEIPQSVQIAFYAAAFCLLAAIGWTVLRTREYSPAQLAAFAGQSAAKQAHPHSGALIRPQFGIYWLICGIAVTALIYSAGQDYQLYILSVGLIVVGIAQMINRAYPRDHVAAHILSDLAKMPKTMQRLAVTQFFTWFSLFIMWAFTTPIVTQYVFKSTDTTSLAYNQGADWVGVLFGVFNAVAIVAALFGLPRMADRIGSSRTHMLCLATGSISFLSIMLLRDPYMLFVSFTGLGIAWASLLTMPYVLLTGALPPQKFGVYMGIFNFFIVLPQLVVATAMGAVLKAFFPDDPIWTMLFAAAAMAVAAISMAGMRDPNKSSN